PGEAAGVAELVRRFGKLPLARSVEPALRLARQGVPVSPFIARMSASFAVQLGADPVMRGWLGGEGQGMVAGSTIRRAELARTLAALARHGADGFYRGTVARQIVAANRAAGGSITLEDLASYRVVERTPLEATRFGRRWVTAPPPSAGGYVLLASLAFLEQVDPERQLSRLELLHALAESWKGIGLDRMRYFGDPTYVDVPVEGMLDPERIAARARLFDRDAAVPTERYSMPLEPETPVTPPSGTGTSHLCVVDAEGNVASVTTTINLPFGARYVAAGFPMNDEMDDFARAVGEENAFRLPGGERNLPGPGRRPVSSMSPTIVFDERGPALCIGASGGSRIPSAVEQVALGIVRDRLPAAFAIERARVHHQGMPELLHSEASSP
ncbi:MAG: gamma-glutamyltransferase, partial [Polyangiaceae bacterium]|nr:gamma-glutamyltransferase [Polyangiaceae bacterium]